TAPDPDLHSFPTRRSSDLSPNRRSQTPCRDKPRSGAGSNLAIFLFFEKPLQVDFADGSGGGIKASAHLDLLAHQVNQFRRNVERSEEHTSELQSLAYLVCR